MTTRQRALEAALTRFVEYAVVGRGTDLFVCEFCPAEAVTIEALPHADDCVVRQGRAALADAGAIEATPERRVGARLSDEARKLLAKAWQWLRGSPPCLTCGEELRSYWRCCPICGQWVTASSAGAQTETP